MTAEKISKKTYLVFLLLLLLLLLCTAGCNTTEPPDPPVPTVPVLTLELEDVSCTEAWIQLKTKELTLPAELTLKQYNPSGDSISKALLLNTQDTLLYIDSLLPNQTYKFHSVIQSINNSSNEINVTTMDTTSHDFSFQTWTFGTIGSSVLYDVAIINENNIIAVGEILVADSSPNGYTIYNGVHWNGNEWTIQRILFKTICGQQSSQNAYPASSIIAFSENEIWVAQKGDQIAKIENGIQTQTICMPWTFSINKIWGSNSNDLYIVGNNGNIAHYNGSQWTKIESGTSLNINDIWGDYNEKTGEWEILAVASNFGTSLEKEILQIKNNSVIKLPLSPQMWPLKTVWFVPNKQYYVAGAGVYQKRLLTDLNWKNEVLDITTFSIYSISGNYVNDVFGVGAYGNLIHYNGLTWNNDYDEPNLYFGSYKSIKTNSNLFFAVGNEYYQAVILKGKR